MQLITKEIEEKFKAQGNTSGMHPKDIKIIVKFFNPAGAGEWYIYDRDKDSRDILWGFVNLGDRRFAECGTVSLRELEKISLPLGLTIERDMHFGQHTLKEVIDTVKSGGKV